MISENLANAKTIGVVTMGLGMALLITSIAALADKLIEDRKRYELLHETGWSGYSGEYRIDRFTMEGDTVYLVAPLSMLVALVQMLVPMTAFTDVIKGSGRQVVQAFTGIFAALSVLNLFSMAMGLVYRIDTVKSTRHDVFGRSHFHGEDNVYGPSVLTKYDTKAQAYLGVLGIDTVIIIGFTIYFGLWLCTVEDDRRRWERVTPPRDGIQYVQDEEEFGEKDEFQTELATPV